MKTAIASLMALAAAGISIPVLTQDKAAPSGAQQGQSDADKMYALVVKARKELREMRIRAGLHARGRCFCRGNGRFTRLARRPSLLPATSRQ